MGYEKVKQQGENGTLRITKKVQKVNGQIASAVITKTDVIKASVPKIIVKGSKVVPNVGNVGVWGWPTAKPYCITSPYGWRWGKLHEAFDISCTGCGSPIYAANNGTVETAILKDSFTLEDRLLSMNETVYAEFVYLWGKIFKHVTGKDFQDEYKAYANHIDAEP